MYCSRKLSEYEKNVLAREVKTALALSHLQLAFPIHRIVNVSSREDYAQRIVGELVVSYAPTEAREVLLHA